MAKKEYSGVESAAGRRLPMGLSTRGVVDDSLSGVARAKGIPLGIGLITRRCIRVEESAETK